MGWSLTCRGRSASKVMELSRILTPHEKETYHLVSSVPTLDFAEISSPVMQTEKHETVINVLIQTSHLEVYLPLV